MAAASEEKTKLEIPSNVAPMSVLGPRFARLEQAASWFPWLRRMGKRRAQMIHDAIEHHSQELVSRELAVVL
jgi:hypothetical protein